MMLDKLAFEKYFSIQGRNPAMCVICLFCISLRVNSPSLECDSEEEDVLGHSYPCSSSKQRFVLQSSSGEERDSFDTSPDFNRSHSETAKKSNKVHLSSLEADENWN